jgi:hypothetical protein
MPCIYEPTPREREEERLEQERAKAIACAALTFLKKKGLMSEFLDQHDAQEAGVSSIHLQRWWKKHQDEDKKRKAAETSAKKAESLAKRARSKLTTAEARALGLK